MFKTLIDTCLWLDLAKDRRQAPLLDLIDEMIRLGMLGLIVPRLVLVGFDLGCCHGQIENKQMLSMRRYLIRTTRRRSQRRRPNPRPALRTRHSSTKKQGR